MTSVLATLFLPVASNGLPPLGGRLFAAYRIAWWALFALAVLAASYALFEPGTHALILGLRLTKSIVLIAVSSILFRRRRTDPVAAMLGLSFLLWTASSSVDFAGTASAWPILLDRCRFLLFAFALLLFPDGQWAPRWTRAVAAAILLVFLIGILEALDLLPTRAFLPLAIGCVLMTLTALMARYKALSSYMAKQQLKWVALGLVAGIALILAARAGAAITTRTTMPMSGTIVLEALFQLGIVVIALGFLTSLLRYRLYDAETAISRSAAYAGLTLALVAIFAGSEAIIQALGQRYFGPDIGDLSGGIAAAIAAALLTPLHSRISGWAEAHFQKDLMGLRSELPDLLSALSGTSSIERMGSAVLPRIEQAIHSTRIALVVEGRLASICGMPKPAGQRWLRRWQAPAAIELLDQDDDEHFPVRMALRSPFGAVCGWLLLGPRPDQSLYGKDELDALAAIAPALQRTVFSVVEREREQNITLASLQRLTAKVSEIEAANGLSRNRSSSI
ncbi:hypothetical protein LVY65_10225 [Sphingomonas sp. G124]|uniref:Uncharacterized protein n=1 Tax=Sphingomonas cremea TaxID=2904799 RepID=A0A9X1QMJ1_9SPHN|nr:hypothetical protein [Sphingomonas cremea]MCF2515436.1 hypothetical protein [Sphingomonas cremea]